MSREKESEVVTMAMYNALKGDLSDLEDTVKLNKSEFYSKLDKQKDDATEHRRFSLKAGLTFAGLMIAVVGTLLTVGYTNIKGEQVTHKNNVKQELTSFSEWHSKDVDRIEEKFSSEIGVMKEGLHKIDNRTEKMYDILLKINPSRNK